MKSLKNSCTAANLLFSVVKILVEIHIHCFQLEPPMTKVTTPTSRTSLRMPQPPICQMSLLVRGRKLHLESPLPLLHRPDPTGVAALPETLPWALISRGTARRQIGPSLKPAKKIDCPCFRFTLTWIPWNPFVTWSII